MSLPYENATSGGDCTVKERPILFSAPMVRALLSCFKTQTRRLVKFKPHYQIEERDDGSNWPWMYDADRDADYWLPCPYGQPGDRLFVREAFRLCSEADATPTRDTDEAYRIWYEADSPHQPGFGKLRPGIHMPRWASRIILEVMAVRVERLQDISVKDIWAEGAFKRAPENQFGRNYMSRLDGKVYLDLASLWARGWESINGPGSWEANPWVWVIEFKRANK